MLSLTIDKNISGIYCIRNLINNKIYVGSSRDIKLRIRTHRNKLKGQKHPNLYLQDSYNKYGIENLDVSILEIVDVNQLAEREQFYIDFYNSGNRKFGYNLIVDVIRHTYSPETRLKISKSCKGRIISEETRAKLSLANGGRKWGEEERKKNESYWTEEARKEFGEKMKKRPKPSPETCKKISESLKGRKIPPEIVKKVAEAHRGKKWSTEMREKMKIAQGGEKHPMYGKKRTQEYKDRISKIHKGRKLSQEVKQKISEGNKGNLKKHNCIPIVKVSLDGIILERYESVKAAARVYGHPDTIRYALIHSKKSSNYQWMYASSKL